MHASIPAVTCDCILWTMRLFGGFVVSRHWWIVVIIFVWDIGNLGLFRCFVRVCGYSIVILSYWSLTFSIVMYSRKIMIVLIYLEL